MNLSFPSIGYASFLDCFEYCSIRFLKNWKDEKLKNNFFHQSMWMQGAYLEILNEVRQILTRDHYDQDPVLNDFPSSICGLALVRPSGVPQKEVFVQNIEICNYNLNNVQGRLFQTKNWRISSNSFLSQSLASPFFYCRIHRDSKNWCNSLLLQLQLAAPATSHSADEHFTVSLIGKTNTVKNGLTEELRYCTNQLEPLSRKWWIKGGMQQWDHCWTKLYTIVSILYNWLFD